MFPCIMKTPRDLESSCTNATMRTRVAPGCGGCRDVRGQRHSGASYYATWNHLSTLLSKSTEPTAVGKHTFSDARYSLRLWDCSIERTVRWVHTCGTWFYLVLLIFKGPFSGLYIRGGKTVAAHRRTSKHNRNHYDLFTAQEQKQKKG